MRTKLTIPLLAVGFVLLTGCGTAHTARPLGKGNTAIVTSLGGPIADLGGATVPVPLPTVGIKYGVTERNDIYADWQVMPAILGNAAFDVGGSWYFLDQHKGRPGLSTAATVHAIWNTRDLWLAADTQLTASWLLHPRHLLYLGFHLMFVPVRSDAMNSAPVHFAPMLGGEVRLGKNRGFGLGLEVKWADPWRGTDFMIVDYAGSRGGICITGGFNFYLGGKKKGAAPASAPLARREDR